MYNLKFLVCEYLPLKLDKLNNTNAAHTTQLTCSTIKPEDALRVHPSVFPLHAAILHQVSLSSVFVRSPGKWTDKQATIIT